MSDESKDELESKLAELQQRVSELEKLEAEHRNAERDLRKVNRALKTLSECNKALVQATQEEELLRDICKIIVEEGGYRLAWVGFAQQDEAKSVRPVAQSGFEDGYLDTAKITWADTERGRGPTGTAIRTGKASIAKNIPTDFAYKPWRKQATKRGYASSIALPLIANDQTLGALNIYAQEPDAFDAEEVNLLTELANNLTYGIVALRTRGDRTRAEEEKEKMHAQLLQAQKMEAIGTLAGGMAHDFNNLITVIRGYTDLLMMDVGETSPLYDQLKHIRDASTYAASLTHQLLVFSRRQPMELTLLNINKTVDNLLKMLTRLIGENITIKTEPEPQPWAVEADKGNLEQVIMNLALNARDAMPKGGTLTIKTENASLDDRAHKTMPEARPGKFVCITVIDTGVGMERDMQEHIFEPFFTTKEQGTGLGLSVVYGIVKQHEGWISVHSKSGKGSTFKVYLPAVAVKAEDKTEEAISLQEIAGSGEGILLVEDDERVRGFASEALGENGYEVFEAGSAKRALHIFEGEKEKINLVFCDAVLPDKSGLELVDQLLETKPGLRVLISSGYGDQKAQWTAVRERGFQFLQKPYNLLDLLRTVKTALQKR